MKPMTQYPGESLLNLTDQLGKIINALDESSLISVTDKHGIITYANKKFCSISGYSAKELLGKNHRILKSGFHAPEFYKELWSTISCGHTWNGEIKNVNKHGQYFWVDTTIVPFLDKDNLPEQYVSIAIELTNQKNIEESLLDANIQLRRASKIREENMKLNAEFEKLKERNMLKEEFSAMITHELKTPLIPMLGYCKMLKTSMCGDLPDEAQEAVEVIENNTKRLEKLIGDIMDSNKLDIGKMKFNFENLQLNDFFEMLDQSYNEVLKHRGIDFVIKLSCADCIVNVDQMRLQQVFDNLIGNSIKFIPEKNGTIEVGGYIDKNDIILYVKDNGIGIPLEKQNDLFKKFYQVDTSMRKGSGGTGLGLAISKGIVETMGGSMWVESDGKNGTTIFLKAAMASI